MDIIQEGHLGTNNLPTSANGCLEFYLDHVAGLEATPVYYAVYERFVKIDDEGFLVRSNSGRA